MMAILFRDTFTDKDFTFLANHTPDVSLNNKKWVEYGTSFYIQNGELAALDNNSTAKAIVDVGASNVTISAKMVNTNSNNSVVFRYTDAQNYFYVVSGTLYKVLNGVSTSLSKFLPFPGNPTVEIVLAGTAITVSAGGRVLASLMDSFNLEATKHGIGIVSINTAFDEITIEGESSAGGGSSAHSVYGKANGVASSRAKLEVSKAVIDQPVHSVYGKANGVATSSTKPTHTRTASDFSIYGKANGISTSSSKPTKNRTAIDYSFYGKGNGASTSTAKPSKNRTATDYSLYGGMNGVSTSSSKPSASRTADDYSFYGKVSGTATSSSRPATNKTAPDHFVYGKSNGIGTGSLKPTVNRTAKDHSFYGKGSGTATSSCKPTSIRTASDYSVFGKANGTSTSSAQPSTAQTASVYSIYAKVNGATLASLKPVINRTSLDYAVYGKSNGMASAIFKPIVHKTSVDYMVFGQANGMASVTLKPVVNKTATDYTLFGQGKGLASASSKPIVSKTSLDSAVFGKAKGMASASLKPTVDKKTYSHLLYGDANGVSTSRAKIVHVLEFPETEETPVAPSSHINDLFGGNGIDTEFERDQINYVPNIQLSEKKSGGGVDETKDGQTSLEQDTNIPYPSTDMYIKIGDTYNYVSNLVSRLQEELVRTYIPITEEQRSVILSSNVVVDGLDTITEQGIPFELYDEAIADPDNPTYALIQDIVEGYAEDVDGNIQLELYPDAKELQINLEELHYVMENTVYNRFIEEEQIPEKPAVDNTFYEKIKEQEGKQQEAYNALQNLHKINEAIYYELLTTAYETSEYFEALEDFEASKRELDDFTRRMNQQTDFISFAQVDSDMTQRCARRINRYVISSPAVDEKEVSNLLSKQYADKNDLSRACVQMKAATKLQVNKQIETKKQNKDVLKTTGGLAMKKRVHDEVITLTNIRNDVFLDLYGMMNNMIEPNRSEGVESFLNQVAEGMELVRDNYKVYLQEMYQAHMIDQEVRFNKVNLAGDKQIARDGYWLLDNLLK